MDAPAPTTVRLRNAWRSSHPWIFQKLVEKPAVRPKPGSIVDVVGVEGDWIGRGFYNGHSRIAVRLLESDPDVAVDAEWFARKIADAVHLRRDILKLDAVSDAWHDSMLVCRKPDRGPWLNLRHRCRRWVQHRANTIGLR